MTLKKYIYHGPTSSCSLRVGEKIIDVMLHPGREVSLPDDHEYTLSLIAQTRLIPVDTKTSTPATSKSVKVKSTANEQTTAREEQ